MLRARSQSRKKMAKTIVQAPVVSAPGTVNVMSPNSPTYFKDTQTFAQAHTLVIEAQLLKALETKQIHVFMQPVVSLPNRRICYMESYMRVPGATAGTYIRPAEYKDISIRQQICAKVDTLLLENTIGTINKMERLGRLEKRHRYKPFGGPQVRPLMPARFLNISAASLTDQEFIDTLLGFFRKRQHLCRYFIFELPQTDFMKLSPRGQKILEMLGHLGFQFSIDFVDTLSWSVQELSRLNISYIKLSAAQMMDLVSHAGSAEKVSSDIATLKANNIRVIVNHIETENTLFHILDCGVEYGQGYFFGKPDFSAAYSNRIIGDLST